SSTASQAATEILIHRAEPGQRRARLAHWPVVSGTLSLKRSSMQGGSGSPTTISAVTSAGNSAVCTVTGAAFTPSALVGLKMLDDNRNTFVVTANSANDITVALTGGGPRPVPGSYA